MASMAEMIEIHWSTVCTSVMAEGHLNSFHIMNIRAAIFKKKKKKNFSRFSHL